MKTFTQRRRPASRTGARPRRRRRRSGARRRRAANSPRTLDRRADDRVRPREAPQHAERARPAGRGDALARRPSRGRAASRGAQRRARRPSGTNSAPASEPATKRAANRARRSGVIGARASSHGRRRRAATAPAPASSPSPRPRRAPARPRYQSGATRHELARRRSRRAPTTRGTRPRPGTASTCRPAARSEPVGRPHGPDHDARAARAQHAVGLGDPALRVGPVLDAPRRDVAVEARRRRTGAPPRRRAASRTPRAPAWRARGASWCGLWSSIVTRAGIHARHDPLGREAGARARVEHVEPASRRARRRRARASRIAGVQNSGLTQRS